jgi:hypothetical protein
MTIIFSSVGMYKFLDKLQMYENQELTVEVKDSKFIISGESYLIEHSKVYNGDSVKIKVSSKRIYQLKKILAIIGEQPVAMSFKEDWLYLKDIIL